MNTTDEVGVIDRTAIDGAPTRTADDPAAAAAAPAITPVTPILNDTAEIRDGTSIVKYSRTEAALSDLHARFFEKRFDLTTTAGDAEARAARKELVKLRTGLEAKRKAFKAPAVAFGKLIDSEAERITKAITALEAPIDDQITADEKRRAEEKAERERIAAVELAEKERVAAERAAGFTAEIAVICGYAVRARGLPSERIARGIEIVEDLTFGDEWEEFAPAAAQAQAETLVTMRAMLAAAQASELAERQAAEQRAEQARVAAANAAEALRLKALAEEMAETKRKLDKQLADIAAAEAARVEVIRLAAVEADRVEAARLAEIQAAEDALVAQAEAQADAAHRALVEDVQRQAFASAPEGWSALLAAAEAGTLYMAGEKVDSDVQSKAPAELVSVGFAEPLPTIDSASTEDIEFDVVPLAAPAGPITFAEPPPVADLAPPISIGWMNERLRFTVTAVLLESLGLRCIESKGRAVLFAATDWPVIKSALIAHIESLA